VSRYAFDNAATQTEDRFHVLSDVYDPPSWAALSRTGLAPGSRCLEIGGGSGSIGARLAAAVGPTGSVMITDIDTRLMHGLEAEHDNVEVVRHDVRADALPPARFDLVHARLVLLHLPERQEVLDKIILALRPGGWLVLEEFDCGWTPVLAAPSADAAALFDTVHSALLGVLSQAGADPLWGRGIHSAIARRGLEITSTTIHAEAWTGGDAAIGLHRANTEQVRDELRAAGVDDRTLHEFWALLDDPSFTVTSYPLVSTVARKPHD
jgi:SAM-dependent methyltransferase